tara:strand:+ start:91538 stop:93049 length:1512 start_codon:yes stop_codon:yes gene_type:complete
MTNNFFVILGNQLFDPKILKSKGCGHVFMAEDFGLCKYVKHHKLKIYLFLCSMREYRDELKRYGFKVSYFSLEDRTDNLNYPKFLIDFVEKNNISKINFFEIEDHFFEKEIFDQMKKKGLKLQLHKSPMFMFSRNEFISLHEGKKNFRLSNFYKIGRKKFNILMNENCEPIGKKWSFDHENRKKIPKNVSIPKLQPPSRTKYHNQVIQLIEQHFSDHHGRLDNIWFPVERGGVDRHLEFFLAHKLIYFGVYEDAIRHEENFLFHSCISPFLNIGLITPDSLLERVLELFNKGYAPINSIEGFVRQVLGWREFIRGIYQMKGSEQQQSNFWAHKRYLSESWYNGSTGIVPLDDSIQSAIKDGYNHHIPRLMVIANLMNLSEIDPRNIYKWFMEMYIDSSDWVMIPNVFGMATFADGGLISTKPYSCSSNYILKMSNYKKGNWCKVVDGLYWRFIDKHQKFYKSNPRLSFQVKMLERIDIERKKEIFQCAEIFLTKNTYYSSEFL